MCRPCVLQRIEKKINTRRQISTLGGGGGGGGGSEGFIAACGIGMSSSAKGEFDLFLVAAVGSACQASVGNAESHQNPSDLSANVALRKPIGLQKRLCGSEMKPGVRR